MLAPHLSYALLNFSFSFLFFILETILLIFLSVHFPVVTDLLLNSSTEFLISVLFFSFRIFINFLIDSSSLLKYFYLFICVLHLPPLLYFYILVIVDILFNHVSGRVRAGELPPAGSHCKCPQQHPARAETGTQVSHVGGGTQLPEPC